MKNLLATPFNKRF